MNQNNKQLLADALAIAKSQVGVLEEPLNSNWGPQVGQYLRSIGLTFPASWCAAFVYWCVQQAAIRLGMTNPLIKTGGCLDHWNRSAKVAKRYSAADVAKNPALVRAGQIFIMDFGGGAGHTGFVLAVDGKYILTLEGNTNIDGSRNGIGVFQRKRSIASINKGFIDYSL